MPLSLDLFHLNFQSSPNLEKGYENTREFNPLIVITKASFTFVVCTCGRYSLNLRGHEPNKRFRM